MNCYKNEIVENLTKQTMLYVLNDDINLKKDTNELIRKSYEKLIEIDFVETFMKYVLCSGKVRIIFILSPQQTNRDGDETLNIDEQILIMCERPKKNCDKIHFASCIFHQFAHYAFNMAFCNASKPYFKRDREMSQQWSIVLDECRRSELKTELIFEVFSIYPDTQYVAELVVRYFQCLILYHCDEEQFKEFKYKYPILSKTCSSVLKNLKKEYHKFCTVHKTNQLMMDSENSIHMKRTIDFGNIKKFSNRTKIVKTKSTALAANLIYHEFKKNEQYFQSKFVFLNAMNLKKIDALLTDLKFVAETESMMTFVINCEQFNDLNEINTELDDLVEKFIKKHVVILLSENENFRCNHIESVSKINFFASFLSEDDIV